MKSIQRKICTLKTIPKEVSDIRLKKYVIQIHFYIKEVIPILTKTIWNGMAFLNKENKDLTDNDLVNIKPAIHQV